MLSQLNVKARQALSAEHKYSLSKFEEWLRQYNGEGLPYPVKGSKLLLNLWAEAHLTGDGEFGDEREMMQFLSTCAEEFPKALLPLERLQNYIAVCERHELRGLSINPVYLPRFLLRYTGSSKLVEQLAERMLSIQERQALANQTMSTRLLFDKLLAKWDSSKLTDREKLARWRVVFATFELVPDTPRDSAQGMVSALGLPVGPGVEILYEFKYPAQSVRGHRFPTIADGGSFHQFNPAPEIAPATLKPETLWGWTDPLDKSYPSQPEVVHLNEALKVVVGPPRFVGKF